MKKVLMAILTACIMINCSACGFYNMTPREMHDFLNGVAENIGNSQLTKEEELIGERKIGKDSYTGIYKSECTNITGKDVIFGGASIETRNIYIYGYIHPEVGNAKVRIRKNWEVIELTPNEDGYFETELSLGNGGNYIMIIYEAFQGTVELTSEYKDISMNEDLNILGMK